MKMVTEAAKKVISISQIVKENEVNSSLKFSAVKGKTFKVYFPKKTMQTTDDNGNVITTKTIMAVSAGVHEFTDTDGKYRSFVCMEGKVIKDEEGNVIYDGTCPFCDFENQKQSWDIFNYRKKWAEEHQTVGLKTEDKESFMKNVVSNLNKERKVKEKTNFIYILGAFFELDENGNAVLENGKPKYEFKIIKWRDLKAQEVETLFPKYGLSMPGGEAMFECGNEEERMLLAKNMKIIVSIDNPTSGVFNTITGRYAGIAEEIDKQAALFDWETLTSAFVEWKPTTSANLKSLVDASLSAWRQYKKELEVNPNALYLEYSTKDAQTEPLEVGGVSPIGSIGVQTEQAPVQPVVQQAPVQPTTEQAPNTSELFKNFSLGQ